MQRKPELKAEPKAQPKVEANGAPRVEPKVEPKVGANGTPRVEAKAEPKVETNGKAAAHVAKNGSSKPAVFRKTGDRIEESYFESLAASVHEHLQKGIHSVVITSAGSGEGKSTITAGLGRALARAGRQSVCIVDTDRFRPTLHRQFGLENKRGLGELLKELYHLDIGRETPGQFGVGDWLEILSAQSKSGELTVSDGDQKFRLHIHKGRIRSVQMPSHQEDMRLGALLVRSELITIDQREGALRLQRTAARPLGEVLLGLGYVDREGLCGVLTEQIRESLRRLLSLRRPECSFSETADAYLPATSGQQADPPMNDLVGDEVLEKLADYLKRPFLTNQIPSFLMDTTIEKLKVLTAGSTPYSLQEEAFALPFERLLNRLGRMFDVVLLDSPPVALASPAEMLAGLADGVLLVVKADGYDLQIVQQAKAQLDRAKPHYLGVVLNHIDMRHKDPMLYYYGAYQP
jgi:Mrp family chromosome partitioning ATPase